MSQEHSSTNDSNSSMNEFSPSSPPPSQPQSQSQSQQPRNSLQYDYEQDQRLNSMKFEKIIYDSAPIARNTIENNRVRIVNYRGIKLTSFNVDGRQLLCLPQAFDFFLKNLVGGLHTVYTKLKRLEIIPIVCNVEQVRILRSLGAIQPGVNRCKLLAPNEFDILYDDCTNSGSRPGRPPKRNSSFQTDDYTDEKRLKFASNLLLHSFSDYNKYPIHSNNNNYLSNSSSTNGNHLFLYNTSAFTPTLLHSHQSNNIRSSTTTTTTTHQSISSNQSRSFTIDAMLSNNRDRLTKPIDLSMTTIDQASSILSAPTPPPQPSTTAAASVNFFHIKNMIELTIENARLREKQLETEITDLKTEITKEQDCRQKLEQDFLQLQRVRNILIKKLKRLNRSNVCSNSKTNLLDKSPSNNTIQIESI
ncbi:unnamed protein product [Adineta steineri]|uniref:SKI/SNO/DAC domain-containing protein n=1 Tax=Adineta steineri TaxID=433720 RepID=A0A814WMA7_9BILA|nr:unnamed protein product [Adineta steineri]CAF3737771.1 unnamed protein product [Adineta steineri]